MVISMENITVNKEFHELHFDSIQALRGLADLFVVFQHVRFLNFGAFGVDIFFCISGFMIMFTTEKSTKYFFRKRLVRILPLYYLMTLEPICCCCCFLPCSNRPDTIFPIWSKVCCLFLLISAAERSSLWYGSAGLSTVKCCSICCFSLLFTSA